MKYEIEINNLKGRQREIEGKRNIPLIFNNLKEAKEYLKKLAKGFKIDNSNYELDIVLSENCLLLGREKWGSWQYEIYKIIKA